MRSRFVEANVFDLYIIIYFLFSLSIYQRLTIYPKGGSERLPTVFHSDRILRPLRCNECMWIGGSGNCMCTGEQGVRDGQLTYPHTLPSFLMQETTRAVHNEMKTDDRYYKMSSKYT